MIAGAQRLLHACFAFREKPRQQQGCLHLCAGHRHLILNRLEMAARNVKRRTPSFLRCDPCSHGLQRSNNPGHGPAGKRFISEQLAVKLLPCQDAAKHPHGRARIAAIQRRLGRLQLRALSLNDDGIVFPFPLHSQSLKAPQSTSAVGARGKIFQPRRAFCDRAQHGIAVGNRFVPGEAERALQVMRRMNDNRGAGVHSFLTIADSEELKLSDEQRRPRYASALASSVACFRMSGGTSFAFTLNSNMGISVPLPQRPTSQ